METANFPASSIVRFERSGDRIIGKYRQVSAPQQHWGFKVGETVIRGAVRGKEFQGEVLLKLTDEFRAQCPEYSVGWAPIQFTIVDANKIYGRWRQAHFDEKEPCKLVGLSWQLYGLEKINVK